MRIFATITAVLLFMFLLTSAPAFSQEGTDRPDHPQDQKAKDKDKDKDRAEPKQNDETKRPDENRRDDSRHDARQQENREHPEAARPQEQTRPEGQARPENRGEQKQRAAGEQGRGQHRGQRIPEEKFRASFGREHHFHVERARIINQAQPQFVYSGYTFELADPWPAEWSFDDDCYIEYVDDDYYLIDTFHPGIRILVFVIG
jgi:hypothetical protein